MAQSEEANGEGPARATGTTLSYGGVFDHMRDAVVLSDREGRIVLWNAAATALFGHTAEEACGRDVRMLVPERLRESHDAGMQRFRETGSGPLIRAGAVLELPALRRDGSEIVVEMTLSKLEAQGHVMAILRDVTERVRFRAEIEADRRRLREANESLESFSYVVGHDLKEPVRAVEAFLDVLAEGLDEAEAREALDKARAANERMRVLLNGLIEWSRATIAPVELRPTDLRAVLLGPCTARYEHMLEERGARLEIVGGFPPIAASEGLLCQLFGNLILNAIRHNPRHAPRVTVQALGEEDGLVSIAVRDDGPGFPAEVKQRIERMRATRPTTVRGGFGMTIALRAAHLLGGHIEIGGAPGGGGEVRVYLRVDTPEERRGAQEAEERNPRRYPH